MKNSASAFITMPDTFDEISRTNTSFGLRELEHAHDEEVVPGIGSLEFVRQASWAVAALELASVEKIQKIKTTPAVIANAIEALGCKLQFKQQKEDYKRRGVNAFKRPASKDLWKFDDLKKRSNYVQNTYRQNVVSALSGLEFCTGSALYNQMKLTDLGKQLAEKFLDGQKPSARTILSNWICDDTDGRHISCSVLSPDYCSDDEKYIMRLCLKSDLSEGISRDAKKRIRLIDLLNLLPENPNLYQETLLKKLSESGEHGSLHAKQIENAIRFEKIKRDARALYNQCANYMVKCSNRTLLTTLCANKDVKFAYDVVRQSILDYHNEAKCDLPHVDNELVNKAYVNIQDTLKYLIHHEGRALSLNGSSVVKGPLLKENGFSPVTIEYEYWKHPRLGQLLNLWRDCNGK